MTESPDPIPNHSAVCGWNCTRPRSTLTDPTGYSSVPSSRLRGESGGRTNRAVLAYPRSISSGTFTPFLPHGQFPASLPGRPAVGMAGATPSRQLPTAPGFANGDGPPAPRAQACPVGTDTVRASGRLSFHLGLSNRAGTCNRRAGKLDTPSVLPTPDRTRFYRCASGAGHDSAGSPQNVTCDDTLLPAVAIHVTRTAHSQADESGTLRALLLHCGSRTDRLDSKPDSPVDFPASIPAGWGRAVLTDEKRTIAIERARKRRPARRGDSSVATEVLGPPPLSSH